MELIPIKKTFVTFYYNKYGELVETDNPKEIKFDVVINTELSPMCRDMLKVIKDKNTFVLSITHVNTMKMIPDVKKSFFDFEFISKIEFEDYYMRIDGWEIFYNAIFDFSKAKRW